MTDSPSASAGACSAGSSAHAIWLVAGFCSPLTASVVSASSLLSAEWSQPLVIGGFTTTLSYCNITSGSA